MEPPPLFWGEYVKMELNGRIITVEVMLYEVKGTRYAFASDANDVYDTTQLVFEQTLYMQSTKCIKCQYKIIYVDINR